VFIKNFLKSGVLQNFYITYVDAEAYHNHTVEIRHGVPLNIGIP